MDTYGYNGNMPQTAYGRAFNSQQSMIAPNAQQFPHYEVKRVDGENGARALPMGPNSSTFANEIASLRQEVQELKNERNLVGVVRYPMSMGYNAGPSPFCGNAYAYQ